MSCAKKDDKHTSVKDIEALPVKYQNRVKDIEALPVEYHNRVKGIEALLNTKIKARHGVFLSQKAGGTCKEFPAPVIMQECKPRCLSLYVKHSA